VKKFGTPDKIIGGTDAGTNASFRGIDMDQRQYQDRGPGGEGQSSEAGNQCASGDDHSPRGDLSENSMREQRSAATSNRIAVGEGPLSGDSREGGSDVFERRAELMTSPQGTSKLRVIESRRIGRVEFDESRVIQFADDILGFPKLTQYILCNDPADETMPFKWLVSVENPELMFLVTDPGLFFSDFVFDLSEEDQKILGLSSVEDVSVIAIITVPGDSRLMTANLRGPLVVNWKTMRAKQIVLKNSAYETKHFLFPHLAESALQGITPLAKTVDGGTALTTETPKIQGITEQGL